MECPGPSRDDWEECNVNPCPSKYFIRYISLCRQTFFFDSIASLINVQNEITLMVLFLHLEIALLFSSVKILQKGLEKFCSSWFLIPPLLISQRFTCVFQDSRDAEAPCRFGLSPCTLCNFSGTCFISVPSFSPRNQANRLM